jgi:hypothetical protein
MSHIGLIEHIRKVDKSGSKIWPLLAEWAAVPEIKQLAHAFTIVRTVLLQPFLTIETLLKHALDQVELSRELVAALEEIAESEAEAEKVATGQRALLEQWAGRAMDYAGRLATAGLPQDDAARADVLETVMVLLAEARRYYMQARGNWLADNGVLAQTAADAVKREATESAPASAIGAERSFARLVFYLSRYPGATRGHIEALVMAQTNGVAPMLAAAIAAALAPRPDWGPAEMLIQLVERSQRPLEEADKARAAKFEEERVAALQARMALVEQKGKERDERTLGIVQVVKDGGRGVLCTDAAVTDLLAETDPTPKDKESVLQAQLRFRIDILRQKVPGGATVRRGAVGARVAALALRLRDAIRADGGKEWTAEDREVLEARERIRTAVIPHAPQVRRVRFKDLLSKVLDAGARAVAAVRGCAQRGIAYTEWREQEDADGGRTQYSIGDFFAWLNGAADALGGCLASFRCWLCFSEDPEGLAICDRCTAGYHVLRGKTVCVPHKGYEQEELDTMVNWLCPHCDPQHHEERRQR